MAQDSVCGMSVPPEQAAAQAICMGKTFYF